MLINAALDMFKGICDMSKHGGAAAAGRSGPSQIDKLVDPAENAVSGVTNGIMQMISFLPIL